MAEPEITAFLSHLATDAHVAASTQNQALAAILFLYKRVLGRELDWLSGLVHAKRPDRLPVVLSRDEVAALLSKMRGVSQLMAMLLYGSGLRVLECAELRVKDLDRVTMLPDRLDTPLRCHLAKVRANHEKDLANAAAITYTRPCYSGPSRRRSRRPESANTQPSTPCAIASQRRR